MSATGITLFATPGVPLTNVTVANFTDPAANAGNSTAVINWGDGQIGTGTVRPTSTPGVYAVTGSHTYSAPGAAASYSITVTIADPNGQTAKASSTALLAGLINGTGTTFSATLGQALIGVPVAYFTDSNPTAAAASISATINWGDGQSTPGIVSGPNSSGVFIVSGNHVYTAAAPSGSYVVTVTIADPSGQSATVKSTAILAAPTIVATGTNFPMIPGQPLMDIVVATFTDSNPAALANPALISAVINWGNGETTQGNVMPAASVGTFNVLSGSYAFPTPGPASTVPVTVTITDPSGQSATAMSTAYVVNTISNAVANPFQFTGSLAQIGGNGPYAPKGFTNTNQPTFSGTAPLFSIVQLYARPFGVDTQIPLGTAVTNGSGQWSLTAGPLLAGQYNISAIVTPSGGFPSAMMSLSNNGLVHIDMVPKHAKPLLHPHPLSANHKTARLPKLVHHLPAPHKHKS